MKIPASVWELSARARAVAVDESSGDVIFLNEKCQRLSEDKLSFDFVHARKLVRQTTLYELLPKFIFLQAGFGWIPKKKIQASDDIC